MGRSPFSLKPPQAALVFENDIYAVLSPSGEISVSDKLAGLLVESRGQYQWRSPAHESQQVIVDLEDQIRLRLQNLSVENAHWIVRRVYEWGGGRNPTVIKRATTRGKAEFEKSIRRLMEGDLRCGLECLCEQPGIALVMATKIYRFCCPGTGAAVDRHSSYFFNSLGLQTGERGIRGGTQFKRGPSGNGPGSRLATYTASGHKHNLTEYLDHYLPLLTALAESLNGHGAKYEYLCAASRRKKQWRPADVEMAAYQWWSRNGEP